MRTAILISRDLIFNTKVSQYLESNLSKMLKLISFLSLLVVMIAPVRSGCPGCVIYLKGEHLNEAASVLNNSLSKLAAGEGPYYR